jgi:hopanoid biosynthesis associated protein HpnK
MRRLIVSGDDFGLHPLINQGIIEAHEHGILTSASLVACGQAFQDAVKLAKAHPKLGVGVHLTFVEEKPISPPDRIRSIVSNNGDFPKTWRGVVSNLIMGRIKLEHLRYEAGAQISRVTEAGITPTHLDAHQHLHLSPAIWRILLPLISKYRIPAVRMIRQEILKDQRGWKTKGLEFLSRRAIRKANQTGLWFPDFAAGTSLGGHMSEGLLCRILGALPEGTTELICHPGKSNRELASCYNWGYDWEQETAALTSPVVKDIVARNHIELCRFEPEQEER